MDPASVDFLNRAPSGAWLIDGRAVAADILRAVTAKTAELIRLGTKPGLAVVLVGENPASEVYVKSKGKAAEQCGFHSVQISLPAST
jgi:methylenetetrahydrofolate dehydrogenase (NADP+) / methenyltetrahydrofolate cyclohydrolase